MLDDGKFPKFKKSLVNCCHIKLEEKIKSVGMVFFQPKGGLFCPQPLGRLRFFG
jgi:hypothetical protein